MAVSHETDPFGIDFVMGHFLIGHVIAPFDLGQVYLSREEALRRYSEIGWKPKPRQKPKRPIESSPARPASALRPSSARRVPLLATARGAGDHSVEPGVE